MCPTQARKITGVKGSGIFDLEENKVDMIDDNLPPWVEVEEALEEAEAPEGTSAQEKAEAKMNSEESIPLPERRKKIQGYPNP